MKTCRNSSGDTLQGALGCARCVWCVASSCCIVYSLKGFNQKQESQPATAGLGIELNAGVSLHLSETCSRDARGLVFGRRPYSPSGDGSEAYQLVAPTSGQWSVTSGGGGAKHPDQILTI